MSRTAVIVGAGPTGLMLAVELGLAGVDTVLLERLPEPPSWSQALSVHMSSVEILRQRGLDCFAGARRLPNYNFGFLGLTTMDEENLPLIVSQRKVCGLLADRATELGVDIRWDHEVTGLVQDDSGVSVEVRTGASEYSIQGAYLVGCDGGRSTIRKLAGIPFPGTDSTLCAITGDVELVDPKFAKGYAAGIHPRGLASAIEHPDEPGVFRATVVEFGAKRPPDDVPITMEEFLSAFRRVSGIDLPVGRHWWMTRFGDATRLVDRYRDRRVLVAGDAAHIHFPSAGQGLNTGVQDAVNLGWKLGAELNGWAPAGLLDSYHSERRPVGKAVCLYPQAQTALMHPLERVTPLRQVLSELIRYDEVSTYIIQRSTGLGIRYPMEYPGRPFDAETVHPLLGLRVRDLQLDTMAGKTSVSGRLYAGHGKALLLDLTGGGCPAVSSVHPADWADRVDLVVAKPATEVDATVLLIRPDGFIAYADRSGLDGDGLRLALTTWFGEPSRQNNRQDTGGRTMTAD